MKNVTVIMEDSVADGACTEAARGNIGMSHLLGELLAEQLRHHDACERAQREWPERDFSFASEGSPYRQRNP